MMKIRDIVVDPPLVLAPMEGVTDLTFRRLIRAIGGCGLTVTEFIPAKALHLNVERARVMAEFDEDERPISIQIYGREPAMLAEAARVVQGLGADIVDLNMGCPSKKVCRNSGGSALMKDVGQAAEIVRAIRAAVSIPFTVKMRAGWDADQKNAPEMARMCEDEGAEAVAVHWRTRTDLYGGKRELDTIARVKQCVAIPVIANGDIVDAASAVQTLAYTGCDGLMVGRGAIRNPWVFQEVDAALRGEQVPDVTMAERERVLLRYLEDIRPKCKTERAALGRFKKISNHFARGVPGGSQLRHDVLHSQSIDQAISVVRAFFAGISSEQPRMQRPALPTR
jgi:tRNA-dihydrouridine synthase B